MARPLRGGPGRAIEEKRTFLKKFFIPMAIKLEGGGKALMAWPLVEDFFFCGFPKPD